MLIFCVFKLEVVENVYRLGFGTSIELEEEMLV